MRDIQPADGYGTVMPWDVAKSLNGLIRGARYSASDLYKRYADVAREAGRLPGHPVALGQEFARLGMTRVKITEGGAGRGHRGRGKQVVAWTV